MASLYRRKKTWWLKYRFRGRIVRESLRTGSYAEARRKKSSREHEIDEALYQPPSLIPLKPFLEEYLSLMRATRSRKSYLNDVSYLRLIFGPICSELVPHNSRGEQLDKKAWLSGRVVKPIIAENLEDISSESISDFVSARIITDGQSPAVPSE